MGIFASVDKDYQNNQDIKKSVASTIACSLKEEQALTSQQTELKNCVDDNRKMVVWFVFGPMGAGKSSYITREVRGTSLVYLSADKLKRDTNLPYLQVRDMMGDIIAEHIRDRKSFVTEGTGQHDDIYDVLSKYKEDPNIDLRVTFIDIPLDIALERNKNRVRVIDDATVKEVYKKCEKLRNRWKDFACEYVNYNDIFIDNESFDFSQVY